MNVSTAKCIVRHPSNPILTNAMVPYESVLTYNVGVIKFQGKYVMTFRNDYGATEKDFDDLNAGRRKDWPSLRSNIGLAFSDDGIRWKVQPKPCFDLHDDEIFKAYDPRLTVIDGRVYMCFATDTRHGLRAGIAVTDDFTKFEVLHLTVPDNRNMVMFPERIGGKYVRLERPFPVYSRGGKDRFDIWLSDSPDCRYWGNSSLVLGVEDVPYSNDKIGPAAPPVKTKKGWLTAIHAVDRDDATRGKNGWEAKWTKRYTAGIMLLDLDDPSKVIGMSKETLIAPEVSYEISGGLRNNVIFPGGMILEPDGMVKLYYGASDTVTCLATAHVDELLALCNAPRK
ncbi:MAG: glycoside hydrolase family 130 protein [Spirochaetes bacterium]|nr:glycoside hydrolase family 130 protein [Spirochaetota bacterium]